MDSDPLRLVARISARADVWGCLILSREGFILAAHPTAAERNLDEARLRLAEIGELERGFVQFAGELWVYVRTTGYGVFAVAPPATRPGVLLDVVDRILEEATASGDQAAVADSPGVEADELGLLREALTREVIPGRAAASDSSGPTSSMPSHPEVGEPVVEVMAEALEIEQALEWDGLPEAHPEDQPISPSRREHDYLGTAGASFVGPPEEVAIGSVVTADDDTGETEGDVDPVALAREFGRLLQRGPSDDEYMS